jgi:hypothetical protein
MRRFHCNILKKQINTMYKSTVLTRDISYAVLKRINLINTFWGDWPRFIAKNYRKFGSENSGYKTLEKYWRCDVRDVGFNSASVHNPRPWITSSTRCTLEWKELKTNSSQKSLRSNRLHSFVSYVRSLQWPKKKQSTVFLYWPTVVKMVKSPYNAPPPSLQKKRNTHRILYRIISHARDELRSVLGQV